jgi:hypothetical protein
MSRPWEADTTAEIVRRPGKSPLELDLTDVGPTCPDIWELSNGDFAVVGRDATAAYVGRLPKDLHIGEDERLVIIPRKTLLSASEKL